MLTASIRQAEDTGVLDEGQVNAIFDQLVSENVIVYGPYESIVREAEGYPMEFRVCEHLGKKPHTVGAKLNPALDNSRKWGPGSDIYCPDERLILEQINDTHDLALNLFCVDKPQLLLLTQDTYQRQYQPLAQEDFEAAMEVLRRFQDIYVIYNCSEAGGCSRMHKHLQGLRGPPFAFDYMIRASKSKHKVPFRFFTHQFLGGFAYVSASDLLKVYLKLLGQVKDLLAVGETNICPHNVVLWKDWIIVIPRRAGFKEGASANAAGMMGCVWVTERKNVDEWERIGYANVLRELGVPS